MILIVLLSSKCVHKRFSLSDSSLNLITDRASWISRLWTCTYGWKICLVLRYYCLILRSLPNWGVLTTFRKDRKMSVIKDTRHRCYLLSINIELWGANWKVLHFLFFWHSGSIQNISWLSSCHRVGCYRWIDLRLTCCWDTTKNTISALLIFFNLPLHVRWKYYRRVCPWKLSLRCCKSYYLGWIKIKIYWTRVAQSISKTI